jgi:hypothetical protein
MSLKPIRQYFKDIFYKSEMNDSLNVDFYGREYEEHNDAFNIENIGALSMDKAYHIFYGSASTSALNHLTTKDTVNVTLSIFSKGFSSPMDALDDAMDFANRFRLVCIKPSYATTGQFIKNVVCDSIEASPVNQDNDNSIVIKLQFKVTVIFGIGINLDCDC